METIDDGTCYDVGGPGAELKNQLDAPYCALFNEGGKVGPMSCNTEGQDLEGNEMNLAMPEVKILFDGTPDGTRCDFFIARGCDELTPGGRIGHAPYCLQENSDKKPCYNKNDIDGITEVAENYEDRSFGSFRCWTGEACY